MGPLSAGSAKSPINGITLNHVNVALLSHTAPYRSPPFPRLYPFSSISALHHASRLRTQIIEERSIVMIKRTLHFFEFHALWLPVQ
jgi:hypothetical protein